MSLTHFLDRIDQSSKKIQGCKFPKYGMFTNAVLDSPGIITLLKDTYHDEALLYGTKELNQQQTDYSASGVKHLQRCDGRRLLKEQNFFEFSDDPDRPFVKVPELAPSQVGLAEVPFVPFDATSNDLEYLIQWNKEVLVKYPLILDSDPHIQELIKYENEYLEKTHNINALEEEVNRNKELINRMEHSGNVQYDRWEEDRALDACIQKQEEEIRELEAQLMQIQNSQ
ncbi:hypothetical protein JA1_003290 [Spathaspora sp. JA1]|nr:hypothetical protein JA1_003290 [Spathaspora sp. JA1]